MRKRKVSGVFAGNLKRAKVVLGGEGDKISDLTEASSSLSERKSFPIDVDPPGVSPGRIDGVVGERALDSDLVCLSPGEILEGDVVGSDVEFIPPSPNASPRRQEEEDMFAGCDSIAPIDSSTPQKRREKKPVSFGQMRVCPQEDCSYKTTVVENMRKHMGRHLKLSKKLSKA